VRNDIDIVRTGLERHFELSRAGGNWVLCFQQLKAGFWWLVSSGVGKSHDSTYDTHVALFAHLRYMAFASGKEALQTLHSLVEKIQICACS
jgi:hypothetical protein